MSPCLGLAVGSGGAASRHVSTAIGTVGVAEVASALFQTLLDTSLYEFDTGLVVNVKKQCSIGIVGFVLRQCKHN